MIHISYNSCNNELLTTSDDHHHDCPCSADDHCQNGCALDPDKYDNTILIVYVVLMTTVRMGVPLILTNMKTLL